MTTEHPNAIELKNITKTFGSVVANDGVTMEVRRGEILALLGENGSGKTTLVNMLAGIYYPDSGEIIVNGEPATIRSPKDAFALGIGMVHQHLRLVDVLTAAENIVLGLPGGVHIKRKELSKRIREIADKYGFDIDPDKRIYDMSIGEKQTVEILKVLYRGADILILDEPTAVLTPQETERLFDVLRRMKEDGNSIIIITHKLNEVLAISDRVAVLRKGKCVATLKTEDADAQSLTTAMVGYSVRLAIHRPESYATEDCLRVVGLTCVDHEGVKKLSNVSFRLKRGEILGVAGVAGSGQRELCEAITGLYPVKSGKILHVMNDKAESIVGKSPYDIAKMGIRSAFVPEDRLGMGLVAGLDMVDNMMLKNYHESKGIFVDRRTPKQVAEDLIDKLGIVAPDVSTPVSQLSGGNVQKVLLGREIISGPSVLVVAYPVRGLDINSSHIIYDLLNEQKQKGVGVLYVGEDLDVLMELCDRLMVLCGGKVSGIVDPRYVTKEEVGLLMMRAPSKKRREGEVQ
ncbi:MAG: ABC transporter ATP-binding protein [Christensenellales bacterium]|jgi:ABC-type uncharacterized transport system ATPase subunit